MITDYLIHLLILIGIYLILSLSLQLSMGFAGLFNVGHIAFYAIGAYTSALLSLNGAPFLICFILAGIIAMFFGFLLSVSTNKLKGDYLALATLAFSFVIYVISMNWIGLTNGSLGIAGIPKPNIFGLNISSNLSFLVLIIIITTISYFIIKKIAHSPFGNVLEAIRDDELATRTLGKNTFKMKSYTLMISAFFAGIAGSLYAHYTSFINPSSFIFSQSLLILCIIIVGGLTSLKGTAIATIVLILLPEPLRLIGFSPSILGPMRQIIYALLLFVILIYKPRGFSKKG